MKRTLTATVNTNLRQRVKGMALALSLLAAPRLTQLQNTAAQDQSAGKNGVVRVAADSNGVVSNGAISEFLKPWSAQQTAAREAEFHSFYAKFLAAARENDKEKLAGLIAFPVRDWSMVRNHIVTTGLIKDRADFLARYNSLFTSFMRLHIPRAKLSMLKDGRYLLVWHDVDTEYGFDFDYIEGAGYRVLSYSIGPY